MCNDLTWTSWRSGQMDLSWVSKDICVDTETRDQDLLESPAVEDAQHARIAGVNNALSSQMPNQLVCVYFFRRPLGTLELCHVRMAMKKPHEGRSAQRQSLQASHNPHRLTLTNQLWEHSTFNMGKCLFLAQEVWLKRVVCLEYQPSLVTVRKKEACRSLLAARVLQVGLSWSPFP